MYTIKSKKVLILNVLEILEKNTDEKHRLTQKDIIDILKNEYSMTVDRKTVKRSLINLIEFGYDIYHDEVIRKNKNGEEEVIHTNWYIQRKFDDSELRLIIDNLLFSKNISHNNKIKLIKKIESLSNKYFGEKIKHTRSIPKYAYGNKELFYTIEILDEAMSENKQVKFLYNEVGVDKKMHPRRNSEGEIREYIINPYQLVVADNAYYLICNNDKFDDVANFRVDRISKIEILNTKRKSIDTLEEINRSIDLSRYMAEHIYMYTGKSEVVRFRTYKYLLTELYDWFGEDMALSDVSDTEVTVSVKVNLEAMKNWALQYSLNTKILSPQSLVESVKEDIKRVMKNYGI